MTQILINTQITILTYLVIGFILYKVKLINSEAQLFISDMTLSVLLPISVFTSFYSSISLELIFSLLKVLLFAIILEVIIYFLTKINFKGIFTKSEENAASYGMLVSNGGLIGTPVVESLFGSLGVMYCNVFMIPTRIMAYSAGESIFNPNLKRSFKDIFISIITNKILIAIFLALIFVVIKINIPEPIFNALTKVGQCLSPFSLILVGSMLAQEIHINLKTIKAIFFITLIRLFIIPFMALGICLLGKLNFMETAIIVLLMGMPIGSTCASFAKKYKGNEEFASIIVFVTTILSTFTLVMLMSIMESIF